MTDETNSMPSNGAPAPRLEAELVADTRDSERRLGLRGRICERRLLFRAQGSYVEMCIPPHAQDGNAWLHGQIVLAPAPKPDTSVWVALREQNGRRELPVQASERGDFALPLPAIRPDDEIQIEIEAPSGTIVARFVA